MSQRTQRRLNLGKTCQELTDQSRVNLAIARRNQMDRTLEVTGFTLGSVRRIEVDGLEQVTTENASRVAKQANGTLRRR